MKYKNTFPMGRITVNPIAEGQSIEEKMRLVTSSNEPIENVAPLVYTEKKDGVLPQYDHRTDRFEQARMAKDRVSATYLAMKQKEAEVIKKAAEEGAKVVTTEKE